MRSLTDLTGEIQLLEEECLLHHELDVSVDLQRSRSRLGEAMIQVLIWTIYDPYYPLN